jgi:hypothetical protein
MFGHGKPVQNAVVARHMARFFADLPRTANPRQVAIAYAAHLFHPRRRQLVAEKKLARSPFHIGVGTSLDEFSEITVEEFGAYTHTRTVLRQLLLDLDDALDAVQSDLRLTRIGLTVEDEVRSVEAQLRAARRKRAIAVTGAGLGTVSAVLVAVYGPAFEQALAILGAAGAGGVWGILQASTDPGVRTVKDNQWYYVWALGRKSRRF